MSSEAVGAVGVPSDELAIAQRVRQLQGLIEQARQGSVTGVTSTVSPGTSTVPSSSSGESSGGDFASALQAATTADSMPSPGAGESELSSGAGASEYNPLIEQAAARYGVDPAVLHGLIQQESDFNPSAQSSAGATGLTQLMPGTAASLGVTNPLNPAESIEGGARYLGQLTTQFGGNTADALAAYNAGPGAVQQYGGVPPYAETQNYVTKVLGYAEAYRQTHPLSNATGAIG